MTDTIQLIKSQALYLAPFLNFVIVYFVFVQDPVGDIWSTLLKCAPIVSLMLYIIFKGFRFRGNEYRISRLVLFGLIFSCTGDVLLNIDLFPYGMAAFGVAHVFYISAFGWRPLKFLLCVPLYIFGGLMYGFAFNKLDTILKIGVPIYAALLLTMCWRAMAQATHKKDFLSVFCAIGSVLFVVSDGLIAVSMFLMDMPYARIYIMITYYVAQLAIALSTAKENSESVGKTKRSKSSRASNGSLQSSGTARRRVTSRN